MATNAANPDEAAYRYETELKSFYGADRLELALFCLNNRILDGVVKAPMATAPASGNGTGTTAPVPSLTIPSPAKLS